MKQIEIIWRGERAPQALICRSAQLTGPGEKLTCHIGEPSVRDAIVDTLRKLVSQANPERADIVSRHVATCTDSHRDILHGPVGSGSRGG